MHGDSPTPLIVRLALAEDVGALAPIYCRRFGQAPWFEVFREEDVWTELLAYLADRTTAFMVAVAGRRLVVGAGIGFPVTKKPDVAELLPAAERDNFYMAELFVAEAYERRGASLALTRARFAAAAQWGYRRFSVRTSPDQPAVIGMYQQHFGAQVVARQQVMSKKVIGGVTIEAPDERVILTGDIPSL